MLYFSAVQQRSSTNNRTLLRDLIQNPNLSRKRFAAPTLTRAEGLAGCRDRCREQAATWQWHVTAAAPCQHEPTSCKGGRLRVTKGSACKCFDSKKACSFEPATEALPTSEHLSPNAEAKFHKPDAKLLARILSSLHNTRWDTALCQVGWITHALLPAIGSAPLSQDCTIVWPRCHRTHAIMSSTAALEVQEMLCSHFSRGLVALHTALPLKLRLAGGSRSLSAIYSV